MPAFVRGVDFPLADRIDQYPYVIWLHTRGDWSFLPASLFPTRHLPPVEKMDGAPWSHLANEALHHEL